MIVALIPTWLQEFEKESGYTKGRLRMSKFKSRKFWVAIGAVIVTLAAGIGFGLKPELIALITAAESTLWVLIEGILDAVNAPNAHEAVNRLASRKMWFTLFAVVNQIALGVGYKLDPAFVAMIASGEAFIWMIIQGIIEARIKTVNHISP